MTIRFPGKDQGLKVCPKCGKVISYNSHFGSHVCDCGFVSVSEYHFEEITDVMLHTIDDIITIADKYNIERDALVKYFVSTLFVMVETATFKDYKRKEPAVDEDKNRD